MSDVIKRESVYLWYYFSVQFEQIAPYWILGMVLGSVVSVFGKKRIHSFVALLGNSRLGVVGVIPASLLGIASPLCMYGTIPIAAAFSQKGLKDDFLAAFMMSSILLNPQLLLYSAALGKRALFIRFLACLLCGITVGVLIHYFYKGKAFFKFDSFEEPVNRDTSPHIGVRLIKNIGRNFKATGGYFVLGVLLSALFQRYVPARAFADLFGRNSGFGVLLAATIGVPLYACGGGTIPLLQQWLADGMSMGAAAAFMLTGPATKITNLGAVKIVLGNRRFGLYLGFIAVFSVIAGFLVNIS